MASVKEIKEAKEALEGGGLDKKALIKAALKKRFQAAYGGVCTEEEIDNMVDEAVTNASSYLYQEVEAQVSKIASSILVLPMQAASLVGQFSTIPASVVGTAAPAAAPMVLGVKSQAMGLKAQLSDTLNTAAKLGIDIPGIDPIIDSIKLIGPLL
jgi:hypothetical protein